MTEGMKLPPIQRKRITVRLIGDSPIQMHKWSQKAIQMMQDKHAGKKTKNRDVRDPEQECRDATYMIGKKYAIPGMAIKRALIAAAHKDLGIEKTLVRKSVFIKIDDADGLIPLDKHSKPWMRTDVMRVGQGSTDLRYRPQFDEWSVICTFEIDAQLLTESDLITLIDRAGFGVGILEGRPEVGRDYGRFRCDPDYNLKVETIS